MRNRDQKIIWEQFSQVMDTEAGKVEIFNALHEAYGLLQEAAPTQAMVDQINQQLALPTPLTLDQLTQIQTVTNPGMGAAIGGALGKAAGWLTNKGKAAGSAVANQVTNPESGLRQGIDKAGNVAGQAAGAVVAGAQKTGQAIAQGAQGAVQGWQGQQQPQADPAAVDPAAVDPEAEAQGGVQRDPVTGQFIKGNQSGTQYAEGIQAQINSLRPGWGNKPINYIDYSDGTAGFGK